MIDDFKEVFTGVMLKQGFVECFQHIADLSLELAAIILRNDRSDLNNIFIIYGEFRLTTPFSNPKRFILVLPVISLS